MSSMESFTQRARRVLSLAHQEAERLHHNYIGTEHLLLGLITRRGGSSRACAARIGFGAEPRARNSGEIGCSRSR